jgi:hypothetical protein
LTFPVDLHGRRLAIVAWGEKPDGTDDVVVFTGTAQWDGRHLTMRRDGSSFQIPDEWRDRLKPVDITLRATLLEADYFFSVAIGDLPDGADISHYLQTGLKWPADTERS